METTAVPTATQGEIHDEPDNPSDPTRDEARVQPGRESDNRKLPEHQNPALTEHDSRRLEDGGRKPPAGDEQLIAEFSEFYAGPTPHVSDIERWERVLPGAADRLLTAAEAAQSHQEDMERRQIVTEGHAFQMATFAVSFFPWALGAVAIVLAIYDQTLVAAIAGLTSVMSGFGPGVISAVRPRMRARREKAATG